MRLDPTQHPVAALFHAWRGGGAPSFGSRPSFFPRAAALCRRLSRYSTFSDGGLPFLEPIPSPPPPRILGYRSRGARDRKVAKQSHSNLIRRLDPCLDALIYTDGSASPNPGRIGLGVAFIFWRPTHIRGVLNRNRLDSDGGTMCDQICARTGSEHAGSQKFQTPLHFFGLPKCAGSHQATTDHEWLI